MILFWLNILKIMDSAGKGIASYPSKTTCEELIELMGEKLQSLVAAEIIKILFSRSRFHT